MKYFIWEGYVEEAHKRAEKIIAKCRKYGCDFVFEELDECEFRSENFEVLRYVAFEVEGTARNGEWELVGSIEHTEKGNVVKSLTGEDLPAGYQTAPSSCDHCHTNRQRKDTFIVRSLADGSLKQVGSTCLLDYTGIPLETALNIRKLVGEIDELSERRVVGNSYTYVSTKQVLAYAFSLVNKFGYVKKETETFSHPSTGRLLRETWTNHIVPITEANAQEAQKAIEWIANLDTEGSQYLHNAQVVASLEYAEYKHFGIIASLVPAYRRAQKAKENASKWVGEAGKKVTVTLAGGLRALTSWETQYGVTVLYAFTDAQGNAYTWKSSKRFTPEELSNAASIEGTVKAHTEYKGTKQTELTRCKVRQAPKAEHPADGNTESIDKALDELCGFWEGNTEKARETVA